MDVMNLPCAQFIGAIRHHTHFMEDEAARARLARFCDAIRSRGVKAFLDDEYPAGGGKALIVNEVAGRYCLADGNAHLVALVACDPDITLAKLVEAAGRDDFIRLWCAGWEEGSGQDAAYETYIPLDVDIRRVPGAYVGTDWFKEPPQATNIMPSTISFDSALFAARDRGRPVGETARALLSSLG